MIKDTYLIGVKFFNKIKNFIFLLGKPTSIITSLIFILAGILLLFWGNRLKRISLILLGFTSGLLFGFYLSTLIIKDSFPLILILLITSGLTFSFLINFLYKIIFILIGGLLGYIASFTLISYFEIPKLLEVIIITFSIILFAFLSLKIEKIMFIIITCYYGYLIFRLGFFSLNIIKVKNVIKEIFCYILLISGVIFQFYEELVPQKYISIEKKKEGDKIN